VRARFPKAIFLKAMKRRPPARLVTKLTVIALALGLAIAPLPALWVERFYANGFYPRLQSLVTPASNLIPFSVIDPLIVALAIGLPAWWIAGLKRARRGERRRHAGALALNTVTLAASVFLAFEALWGFNYMRPPLSSKVDYDEGRLTSDAVKQLKRLTIERLNALAAEARAARWPDEEQLRARLHESLNGALGQLGGRRGIAAARPKATLFQPYLAAAGISGFLNPFGHEVILDRELFAFEKPFALGHEWAHLAGFANEAEASFVGLIACLQSDSPELQYSGWLALYQHTPWLWERQSDQMSEAEMAQLPPRLRPEVVADLQAINERTRRRVSAAVSRAQERVYDGFLKANRVKEGIASYGLLVNLVVGTSFGPDWVPARREGAR
jgi:hypothetical protein